MSRRILISGASVAGNAAAWWLGRYGHDVTVIESAAEFRDGGQNIDVRGVGRDVLKRMGLDSEALERGTGEEGTAWVNSDNSIAAEFANKELESDGPTAELEILRGDLAKLLYESASAHVKYRFGMTIENVEDGADSAAVTFSNGETESFDLVVIAEGVGSATRELVFKGENDPRWMDLTIAYFTIPRSPQDDRLWRWYNAPGGRSISLRPDTHGTTRANFAIQEVANGEQKWDQARQKAYMRNRFLDAGWQADRIIAGMEETEDFYFDVLRQVRMKSWSKGRVVLTGDAAWCATPLAGIGATLSLTGACVLAGELELNRDTAEALSSYEQALRPMIEDGQGVPKIGTRLMHPRSRLGIHLLHSTLNVASKPTIRDFFASKFLSNQPKSPDLASYPMPAN
ncbi:FAD-dependent monooxygenase [Rhizobium sp. NFR03]|uniref:FAD-dependent monooxygenase n=1 Tax=Rhizobium sp. NFR03 TaxID=1566263 RepID=UPI0008CB4E11|nr:FAD-dependent monooxygenase [Rhizobium sp. NFR03]SES46389.1 2-polyprenyl-6-methoxyphenol hydroxylase [Rhizobium sp. NFR03]